MSEIIQTIDDDDDTPDEFDFTRAVRGKFYHPNASFKMPGMPDFMSMAELNELAASKNVSLSNLFKEWAEQASKVVETNAT